MINSTIEGPQGKGFKMLLTNYQIQRDHVPFPLTTGNAIWSHKTGPFSGEDAHQYKNLVVIIRHDHCLTQYYKMTFPQFQEYKRWRESGGIHAGSRKDWQ